MAKTPGPRETHEIQPQGLAKIIHQTTNTSTIL